MKDVIEESKRQPVLIDFWAPWCGPCKQLTPILEKVVKGAKGKVKLVKMNIDEHPAIPGQMGIQSIPAVIAFVNGQPADGFMGALPEGQVNAFIERLTKGAVGGRDQGAARPRPTRRSPRATPRGGGAIYSEILAEDKANIAGARRPRPLLRRGRSEIEKAKQILTQVPEAKRNDAAVRGRARPRSTSPSRRARSARSASLSRRSRPIRSTTRRASILPSRSTPPASARRRSII